MNLFGLVGGTPLVELENCAPRPGVRLFAKLEGQNPTGSIKDRIVVSMVERARGTGRLRPGQEIVEASTGNTGIALAMVGRRLGHPVRVVLPETAFPGVMPALEAFGAAVVRIPAERGMGRAIEKAQEIAIDEGAYLLNQFESPDNPRCHYDTTGVEILSGCPEIDVLVCGLGTGGTLMGAGRRLKEERPGVRLVAAEPHPGDQLQGLRSMEDGFVPPLIDLSFLDGRILVRAANAFRAVREIVEREGLLVGPSSGAVMHAALKWATRLERGNMVLVFADSGWKYVDAPIFRAPAAPAANEEELDEVLWW
jgi:[CysO sulfur-carrier protein]-thiocarboxylate-dependent cysteine synthase